LCPHLLKVLTHPILSYSLVVNPFPSVFLIFFLISFFALFLIIILCFSVWFQFCNYQFRNSSQITPWKCTLCSVVTRCAQVQLDSPCTGWNWKFPNAAITYSVMKK
jgi:hypothetical protein